MPPVAAHGPPAEGLSRPASRPPPSLGMVKTKWDLFMVIALVITTCGRWSFQGNSHLASPLAPASRTTSPPAGLARPSRPVPWGTAAQAPGRPPWTAASAPASPKHQPAVAAAAPLRPRPCPQPGPPPAVARPRPPSPKRGTLPPGPQTGSRSRGWSPPGLNASLGHYYKNMFNSVFVPRKDPGLKMPPRSSFSLKILKPKIRSG